MKRKTPELVRSTTRRCRLRWVLASTPRRVSRTLMPPPVQVPPAPWVGENPCPRAASPGGAVAAQGVGAGRAHRGWFPSGVEEPAVVGVGGRGENVQGQAVAVGEQVVLGARVRVVGGVRAGQLAPLFWARTDTEPMLAPAQSRICFSESSSSTARWGFSQTPAACHSRRRNQAVCPDPRPRVGGRAATDTEVCSTNKMPCTAARSSIRGRLPGPRGGGRGGMSGAISSHSRSSTAASSWPYRNGHPAGRGRSTIGQVLRTDVR